MDIKSAFAHCPRSQSSPTLKKQPAQSLTGLARSQGYPRSRCDEDASVSTRMAASRSGNVRDDDGGGGGPAGHLQTP